MFLRSKIETTVPDYLFFVVPLRSLGGLALVRNLVKLLLLLDKQLLRLPQHRHDQLLVGAQLLEAHHLFVSRDCLDALLAELQDQANVRHRLGRDLERRDARVRHELLLRLGRHVALQLRGPDVLLRVEDAAKLERQEHLQLLDGLVVRGRPELGHLLLGGAAAEEHGHLQRVVQRVKVDVILLHVGHARLDKLAGVQRQLLNVQHALGLPEDIGDVEQLRQRQRILLQMISDFGEVADGSWPQVVARRGGGRVVIDSFAGLEVGDGFLVELLRHLLDREIRPLLDALGQLQQKFSLPADNLGRDLRLDLIGDVQEHGVDLLVVRLGVRLSSILHGCLGGRDKVGGVGQNSHAVLKHGTVQLVSESPVARRQRALRVVVRVDPVVKKLSPCCVASFLHLGRLGDRVRLEQAGDHAESLNHKGKGRKRGDHQDVGRDAHHLVNDVDALLGLGLSNGVESAAEEGNEGRQGRGLLPARAVGSEGVSDSDTPGEETGTLESQPDLGDGKVRRLLRERLVAQGPGTRILDLGQPPFGGLFAQLARGEEILENFLRGLAGHLHLLTGFTADTLLKSSALLESSALLGRSGSFLGGSVPFLFCLATVELFLVLVSSQDAYLTLALGSLLEICLLGVARGVHVLVGVRHAVSTGLGRRLQLDAGLRLGADHLAHELLEALRGLGVLVRLPRRLVPGRAVLGETGQLRTAAARLCVLVLGGLVLGVGRVRVGHAPAELLAQRLGDGFAVELVPVPAQVEPVARSERGVLLDPAADLFERDAARRRELRLLGELGGHELSECLGDVDELRVGSDDVDVARGPAKVTGGAGVHGRRHVAGVLLGDLDRDVAVDAAAQLRLLGVDGPGRGAGEEALCHLDGLGLSGLAAVGDQRLAFLLEGGESVHGLLEANLLSLGVARGGRRGGRLATTWTLAGLGSLAGLRGLAGLGAAAAAFGQLVEVAAGSWMSVAEADEEEECCQDSQRQPGNPGLSSGENPHVTGDELG